MLETLVALERETPLMQGALILFLILFLMLILTSWVLAQPLRRNEAMREIAKARSSGAAYPAVERRTAERRTGGERRVAERRRTEDDASLGHA